MGNNLREAIKSNKRKLKKFKKILAVLLVISLIPVSSGCAEKTSDKTISLTIWHVYGEQSDSPLNDLIDEFNTTVGMQKGINVKATKISDTNTLHEAVLQSEKGGPGTEDLPDIFVAYPKTVLAMVDSTKLVDYNDYLTEEEKDAFIDDFLPEGEINGRLTVLPIAKSTEVLFVNKTLFDRFAEGTGVTLDDLGTWEGLFKTACLYREKTGKAFLADDYMFNYYQLGFASHGKSFFSDNGIVMDEEFEKLWNPMAEASIKGGIWLGSGYATEAIRTGDAIVSFASSAGVLYYSDSVTYEDNTTEEVELITLPSPTYEGGEKVAMNRGAGLCLLKTDSEREEAAMTFIRWLLEPERNVDFVTQAGYMPVTEKGFTEYLPDAVGTLESSRYKSLYKTFMNMQKEYKFYTPPHVSFYLDKETLFEKNIRQFLSEEEVYYFENTDGRDNVDTVDTATQQDASSDKSDKKSKLLDECMESAFDRLEKIME